VSAEPDRVAAIAQITTHAASAVALLPRVLRTRPRVLAVLAAWARQLQEIEDALWALLTSTLDTAVGARLDQFGALLLQARGALADDAYRAVLRACVLARKSRGTAADLCAVLHAMLAPGAAVTYAERGFCVVLEAAAPLPIPAAVAVAPLRLAKAGGVLLELVSPPDGTTKWFAFADPGELLPQSDPDQGFADAAVANTGGPLVGVVT
jgi:hypothetical protein